MTNQELRTHYKILHREEELLARTKRKLEKKIRRIDNLADLMHQQIDSNPILNMLELDKMDEIAKHNLIKEINEGICGERSIIKSKIETQAFYVENIQENSNKYPSGSEGALGDWSVERWRTRTKPHNKIWKNGIIIPMYFWT